MGAAPAASQGFSATEPKDGAPAYEFVPDDVYDTYAPYPEDDAPEPNPQAAAVAALSGASKNPVPAAPESAPLPWEAPAPKAPAAPAPAPTDGDAPAMPSFSAPDDPAAIELAQMLSAAFGGYVKVSHDS